MLPDAAIIEYCANILNQHANWVHSLPELGSHKIVPKIQQVSTMLRAFLDCQYRTLRPATTPGSQCEEDQIIAALLPPPLVGTYLDIGAGEPVQCSNTWSLYQRGWRGLLIEPFPEFILQLLRQRPGDRVFPVAASNQTGLIPFYVDGTVSSCIRGWSSTAASRPLAVERWSVAEILDLPDFRDVRDSCQFCSIDVEGHEREILENLPWGTFAPQVLCIEYRKYETTGVCDDLSIQWEPLVLQAGYRLHAATAMNKIFVKA